jgi:transcriptional regulator with XRE-family HTH domain
MSKPRIRCYPLVTVCPDRCPVGLGRTLKSHRDALGLRQADLASMLGIARASIAGYETDRAKPSFAVMRRMAQIFHVSIEDLLDEAKDAALAHTPAP